MSDDRCKAVRALTRATLSIRSHFEGSQSPPSEDTFRTLDRTESAHAFIPYLPDRKGSDVGPSYVPFWFAAGTARFRHIPFPFFESWRLK